MIAMAKALSPSTVPSCGSASVSGTTRKPAKPASAAAAAYDTAWMRRVLIPIRPLTSPLCATARNALPVRVLR
jgi:hypothetical protein